MTDEIKLTIPRERALYGVAHLVLGGLGILLVHASRLLEHAAVRSRGGKTQLEASVSATLRA